MMEKFRRIFVIVADSLGVGAMPDSPAFGDVGVNTLGHISQTADSFHIPTLQKLGLANITPLKKAYNFYTDNASSKCITQVCFT